MRTLLTPRREDDWSTSTRSGTRLDRQVPRRAILATLTLAGLRIGELVELRWRDIDRAAGRITLRARKTDAGARTIDLLPALAGELRARKATVKPKAWAERVFTTRDGAPLNQGNVRNRMRRDDESRAQLARLVGVEFRQRKGSSTVSAADLAEIESDDDAAEVAD